MSGVGQRRSARTRALGFALVFVLVFVYAASSWTNTDDPEPDAVVSEDPESGPRGPRIVDIQPNKVPPGGTVALYFDPGTDEPGQVSAIIGGVEVSPDELRGDEVVFTVPELANGKTTIRLVVEGQRSKPKSFSIEPLNYSKIIRNVVGGLAFVILGLLTLSRAFRNRVGTTLRRQVGTLTRSMRRSLLFGGLIGGVSQTSTLAAALALPSAERNMLSFRSAVTLVLGAQLGAVAIGAVLPLAASREAPLVIAVGVILRLTASDNRGRSTAKLITGLGLLLHGAHTLRAGFAPLAEQPSWLLELRHLDPGSFPGLALAAGLGAIAAFIAQGPSLVFVIVLSVSQATSFLGVEQALAILAGTSLGAAMSTALVAYTLGQISRRVALAHGVLALATVVLMWLMIPWLPDVVAAALETDVDAIERGKKLLHPNVGLHLAVVFVTMQAVATLAVLPLVGRLSHKMSPAHARTETAEIGREVQPIDAVLTSQKTALEAMLRVLEGDAEAASEVDGHLERARARADAHIGRGSVETETLVSILAVQQSLEQIRYVVARAARHRVRLEGEGKGIVAELHAHLIAGLDDAMVLIRGDGGPDIDDLRTREIQINAAEAAFRKHLRLGAGGGEGGGEGRGQGETGAAENMLRLAELANGYETVGNQLYRLGVGLIPEEF